MQCPRQFGAGAFQFGPVRQCELSKDRAAGRRQLNPDFALVFNAGDSRDGAGGLQAVHQFDSAVMLKEEARGNLPNGRLYTFGKALHGQQQLMLLRLDAMLPGRGFTEMEELPDLAAELGQIVVLAGGKVSVTGHIYIVTRYKIVGHNFGLAAELRLGVAHNSQIRTPGGSPGGKAEAMPHETK
jgi:hypothetical protein